MSHNLAQSVVVPVSRSQSAFIWLSAGLSNGAKRSLDIFASLVGLVLLCPLFLVIGVAIERDTPGPIFYRGRRVGKDGRIFGMLKFRTMYEDAASCQGPKVTSQNDSRVTRLGRWLRESKINELPQLWNVLKGEMSLVGPRPEDPEIAATWPEETRREVFSVRPGITSPSSVLYRDEESLLGSGQVMETYLATILPSKLRLDQLYVRHRSLWLDLDILFWTLLVLLPMWRSRSPGEDLLFWGPVSRLARRYLNWFLIDTLLTFCAIGLTGFLWRLAGPLDIGLLNALLIALGFAFLFSLTSATLGLNRIAWGQAYASDAWGLIVSASLAMIAALLVNDYLGFVPPGMIVTAAALALLGFVGVRYRSRLLTGLGFRWLERPSGALAARERVLIVGSGLTGQFIAWLIGDGASSSAMRVIGYVDDDLHKQGIRYRGVSVVGRRADIPHLATQHDVGIIVFAIHNISGAERERVLAICRSTPARVVVMPDILGDINSLVSEKVNGANAPTYPEPRAKASPLFASERIPPVQVQLWLADLEKISETGDLAAVRDRIRSIRKAARDWRA